MKKMILALGTLLLTVSAFAGEGTLDGKSYCRTILSDGTLGLQKGLRKHCISFSKEMATDTANTFFGNPPERAAYTVKGRIVSFADSKFVLAKDLSDLVSVSGSTVEGTVLTLDNQTN